MGIVNQIRRTGATGFGRARAVYVSWQSDSDSYSGQRYCRAVLLAIGVQAVQGSISANQQWARCWLVSQWSSCGRAHVMVEASRYSLLEFRELNVDGTLCLARPKKWLTPVFGDSFS